MRQALSRTALALTIAVALASTSTIHAQQPGTWQVYPAYTVATKCVAAGTQIFVQTESRLMAYDSEDQSINTYDQATGLSDITVSEIAYCAAAHRLVIIYDNGNIDLLDTDDNVVNLAQLKNSTLQNKTINAIAIQGTHAYIATGFGILVVDVRQGIITKTFDLGVEVKSVAATADLLYAATTQGLWRGHLTKNLLDKSNWEVVNANSRPTFLGIFNGQLWVQLTTECYVYDVTTLTEAGHFTWRASWVNILDDAIIMGTTGGRTLIATAWDQRTAYDTPTSWNWLTRQGNTYWAAAAYDGLQGYTLRDEAFVCTHQHLHPNSPLHDYAMHLNHLGDELLVAGGNWNYAYTSRPGTAMVFDNERRWHNFGYASATAFDPESKYIDVTEVVRDPKDAGHYYVGTARSGIYEFRGDTCTGHLTLGNSPLQSILPSSSHPKHYVVGNGLQYDPYGNLWMLNCTEAKNDTIIRILKPNGTWTRLYYPEIVEATTMDRIIFDSEGRAWINSRRMESRGIFCLDWKGTLVQSDDRHSLRSVITNQDGKTYAPDQFYCIAEDHDGNIWTGTNLGPFVITDPNAFTSSSFTFEQVKVNRTDGSELADYLLSSVPILSITVDGGNRKWFGTLDNGAYLMSADCQEELLHFTTENSPLCSDNVYDIAIDPATGEVFFATDRGLCSYAASATKEAETLEDDAVEVFPNPVTPDYNGLITVRGLAHDTEVKVVSTDGSLVWKGTSVGGTFTWNGLNQNRRRCASGIYHIVANDDEGNTAVVARIAFVR